MKLWLFDIDGTLVNMHEPHAIAYQQAFRAVASVEIPLPRLIAEFGQSSTVLFQRLCTAFAVSLDRIPELNRAYNDLLEEYLSTHLLEPLPGVVQFLDRLDDQCRGIVTGNPPENARLILDAAGLLEYFPVISGDTGQGSRTAIVRDGIAQARAKHWVFDGVVVIGDTPHDIAAGKENGAYTIALATTRPAAELKDADLLLKDWSESRKISL